MNQLYPLKFAPIFKEKIWGGRKMETFMGAPIEKCGEAWILSGVEGNESIVTNGFLEGNNLNELIEVYMYDLVGEENYNRFGQEFPVLVKIIDANDWLSIQVHPDDALAMQRKIGRGKTEMWYILEAEHGARLISGFSRQSNRNEYLRYLEEGRLPEILNFENVEKGDVFFMPAGRVHALGPGILLAEIQETSDTTYRIFDWNRTDDEGKPRELHLEEALDAIDFNVHNDYKIPIHKNPNQTVPLADCEHFTTNVIHLAGKSVNKDLSALDSFVAYICTQGMAGIQYPGGTEKLKPGEAILVPAITEEISIIPYTDSELLEIYIR